jgi:hypothetical protein
MKSILLFLVFTIAWAFESPSPQTAKADILSALKDVPVLSIPTSL